MPPRIIWPIRVGSEKIPKLLKRQVISQDRSMLISRISDGGIQAEISLQILALPKANLEGEFWSSAGSHFKKEPLEPVSLKINDSEIPEIVMEDGTHFLALVTAPETLTGSWRDFEEPFDPLGFDGRYNVGRKRNSLGLAMRIQGEPVLKKQEIGGPKSEIELQEYARYFYKAETLPNAICSHIGERAAVDILTDISGEFSLFTKREDLIFHDYGEESNPEIIDAIVYLAEEKQLTAMIERPPSFGGPGFPSPLTLGQDFIEKEIVAGRGRKLGTVNVTPIEPIAAFQLALIGESDQTMQFVNMIPTFKKT